MYKGLPWENKEEIFINNSESDKPKFEKVIGSNNKAEANIGGITPGTFIFKGKIYLKGNVPA